MSEQANSAVTTSKAVVATERAARYGKQLCSHFSHKIDAAWEDVAGHLHFVGAGKDNDDPRRAFDGEGRVTLKAADDALHIAVEAPAELIRRFEAVVARHLVRFGKDLTVRFDREDGTSSDTFVYEDKPEH